MWSWYRVEYWRVQIKPLPWAKPKSVPFTSHICNSVIWYFQQELRLYIIICIKLRRYLGSFFWDTLNLWKSRLSLTQCMKSRGRPQVSGLTKTVWMMDTILLCNITWSSQSHHFVLHSTWKSGADVIGINCRFDPSLCLETIAMMKAGLESAGFADNSPYLMVQPVAYHTQDVAQNPHGLAAVPENPFGECRCKRNHSPHGAIVHPIDLHGVTLTTHAGP